MQRLDGVLWAAALAALCGAATAADVALYRQRAAIQIEQPGAFVRLPLTPQVYAHSQQRGLADLQLQDAKGERVPFAFLTPSAQEVQAQDQWQAATLYRLPPRPAAGGTWAAPVDVVVEGGRITVHQRATTAAPANTAPTNTAPTSANASPGWLFDLGERAKDSPAPARLQLQWSGPAEFSASYTLQHSSDLKSWREASGGSVMALASSGVALTQPDVLLPADVQRFVRLVWTSSTGVPQLGGARAATPGARSVVHEAPHAFNVAASEEPAGSHNALSAQDKPRALHFDLGAVLPLLQIDLQMAAGTRVLPVQVQVRERSDAPWQNAAGTVFYRTERGSDVQRSPPLTLRRDVRYVRLLADARSAPPPADSVKLSVQAQLGSLVFAAQGQPPYVLLVGASQPVPGALPLATLVPDLAQERPRLGRATLGTWSEVSEAVAQAKTEAQRALWRPAALWALLVAGVAGLALMVWRLARGGAKPGA